MSSRMWISVVLLLGCISAASIGFSNSGPCGIVHDSGIPLPEYEKGSKSLMRGLHQEWRNTDGEKTFIVARKMFWGLLLNPAAFYREFSPDTTHYRQFVDNIDKLVFWNPVDSSTEYYERLRLLAIDHLSKMAYSICDEHLEAHKDLITELKTLEVTHVH